ncbi:Conserved_hypothetical protein [Hexamita inflata]|uniref:Cilia- and flagella-associated protein 57 n=1 Tax=Hexamita inflata TaxID=28002 RepID=A0ABP1H051_9EUKA
MQFSGQRSVQALGLSLSAQNSLMVSNGQPMTLNSSALTRYKFTQGVFNQDFHLPLGQDDQIAICVAQHPSEPLIITYLSGSQPQLLLFNILTNQVQAQLSWTMSEISALQFSVDGQIIIATQRAPAAILIITIEQQQLVVRQAITDILPASTPFVPKYLIQDPENSSGFVIEIAMRGFYLDIQKIIPPVKVPNEPAFNVESSLTFMDVLTAANCCCFVKYKQQLLLIIGYSDSRVSFCYKEVKLVDVEFPFSNTFNQTFKTTCNQKFFRDCLQNKADFKFKELINYFTPNIVPKDAQQPKFGVSGVCSWKQQVYVGLKGGLVLKFNLASKLKQVAKKEEYDSDEETNQAQEMEDMPRIELVNTYNLNLDRIINQQIGANHPKMTIDFVSATQEEQQQWSDSRSQIELLNLCVYEQSLFAVVYDPITLQAVPVQFEAYFQLPYSILHKVIEISRPYIAVFNYVYYGQINALKSLLGQVYDMYSQQKTSKTMKTTQSLSLLQITTGQLTATETSNPLLTGYVPNQILTQSDRAILLRIASSALVESRFALATREGLIILYDLKLGVIAQCKVMDAILQIDLDNSGTELAVTCTDLVRFFKQNGRFLNQIHEIGVKMAQIVKYSQNSVLICANAKVILLDRLTKRVVLNTDGHNSQISAACFCGSNLNKNQYFATADVKGMLQLWQIGVDKSLVQFNARGEFSSIQEYRVQKGYPVLLCTVSGQVCTIDLQRCLFEFRATVQGNNSFVAARDSFCVGSGRVLVSDAAGCIWSVSLADTSKLTKEGEIYILPGKLACRYSNQQQVDKKPEINYKESGDIAKVPFEKAVVLNGNSDNTFLIACGTQPGGQLSIVKLDDIVITDDQREFTKTVSIDVQLFQKLIKIRQDLQDRAIQVQLDYEHQIKVQLQNNQSQLEVQKGLAEKEIKQQTEQCKLFAGNAEKEAEILEQKLQDLDKVNSEQLQIIENDFRDNCAKITKQKKSLEEQIQQLNLTHQNKIQALQQSHEQRINELDSLKEKELAEQEKKKMNLLIQKDRAQKQFAEMLNTADEDADTQLQEQVLRSKKELEKKQLQIQTFTAESGMIRNKFASIRKQTLAYFQNNSGCENTIQQHEQTLRQLYAQREETEAEKKTRRDQITESEEKIYAKKQEAKELEKHRFVLDFKIKDLRKLIQPREQEIHDLQEQTKEVGFELENYHKAIGQLSNQIEEQKSEQLNCKNELENQRTNQLKTKSRLQKLEHELAHIVEVHGQMNYEQLKTEVEKLFEFGGKSTVDSEKKQADLEKLRHKKFLYEAAKQLSQQLQEGKEDVVQENQRIVEENTELLKEAAVLRREIQKIIHAPVSQNNTESQKVFQMRITAQEAEIKRLQKRKNDLDEMQGDDE